MLTGPSVEYLKHLCSNPKNAPALSITRRGLNGQENQQGVNLHFQTAESGMLQIKMQVYTVEAFQGIHQEHN